MFPLTLLPACGAGSAGSALKQIRGYSVIALLVAVSLAGCGHDPNARKQKYLQSGDHYFAEKKYPEALIQYSSALKIDAHFAAAHYAIANAHMQMGSSQNAFAELTATVDGQPDNLGAELDLGNLLLVGHDIQGARAQSGTCPRQIS